MIAATSATEASSRSRVAIRWARTGDSDGRSLRPSMSATKRSVSVGILSPLSEDTDARRSRSGLFRSVYADSSETREKTQGGHGAPAAGSVDKILVPKVRQQSDVRPRRPISPDAAL